jgi:hypothetical protein
MGNDLGVPAGVGPGGGPRRGAAAPYGGAYVDSDDSDAAALPRRAAVGRRAAAVRPEFDGDAAGWQRAATDDGDSDGWQHAGAWSATAPTGRGVERDWDDGGAQRAAAWGAVPPEPDADSAPDVAGWQRAYGASPAMRASTDWGSVSVDGDGWWYGGGRRGGDDSDPGESMDEDAAVDDAAKLMDPTMDEFMVLQTNHVDAKAASRGAFFEERRASTDSTEESMGYDQETDAWSVNGAPLDNRMRVDGDWGGDGVEIGPLDAHGTLGVPQPRKPARAAQPTPQAGGKGGPKPGPAPKRKGASSPASHDPSAPAAKRRALPPKAEGSGQTSGTAGTPGPLRAVASPPPRPVDRGPFSPTTRPAIAPPTRRVTPPRSRVEPNTRRTPALRIPRSHGPSVVSQPSGSGTGPAIAPPPRQVHRNDPQNRPLRPTTPPRSDDPPATRNPPKDDPSLASGPRGPGTGPTRVRVRSVLRPDGGSGNVDSDAREVPRGSRTGEAITPHRTTDPAPSPRKKSPVHSTFGTPAAASPSTPKAQSTQSTTIPTTAGNPTFGSFGLPMDAATTPGTPRDSPTAWDFVGEVSPSTASSASNVMIRPYVLEPPQQQTGNSKGTEVGTKVVASTGLVFESPELAAWIRRDTQTRVLDWELGFPDPKGRGRWTDRSAAIRAMPIRSQKLGDIKRSSQTRATATTLVIWNTPENRNVPYDWQNGSGDLAETLGVKRLVLHNVKIDEAGGAALASLIQRNHTTMKAVFINNIVPATDGQIRGLQTLHAALVQETNRPKLEELNVHGLTRVWWPALSYPLRGRYAESLKVLSVKLTEGRSNKSDGNAFWGRVGHLEGALVELHVATFDPACVPTQPVLPSGAAGRAHHINIGMIHLQAGAEPKYENLPMCERLRVTFHDQLKLDLPVRLGLMQGLYNRTEEFARYIFPNALFSQNDETLRNFLGAVANWPSQPTGTAPHEGARRLSKTLHLELPNDPATQTLIRGLLTRKGEVASAWQEKVPEKGSGLFVLERRRVEPQRAAPGGAPPAKARPQPPEPRAPTRARTDEGSPPPPSVNREPQSPKQSDVPDERLRDRSKKKIVRQPSPQQLEDKEKQEFMKNRFHYVKGLLRGVGMKERREQRKNSPPEKE